MQSDRITLAAHQAHRPWLVLVLFVVFVYSALPLAIYAARHRS